VAVSGTAVSLRSADPKALTGRGGGTGRWILQLPCVLVFPPAIDLAPGVDEIYEESKEVFLTPGHPQDGQVVFYKVGSLHSYLCSSVFSRASQPGAASCWVPAPWPCVIFVSWSCTEVARRGPGGLGLPYPGGQSDSASSRLQQHRVC